MRNFLLFVLLFVSRIAIADVLPPTGTISISSTAICLNGTGPDVVFTGSGGAAPYTFVYQVNGGANQSVTSNGAGIATVVGINSPVGVKTYTLVSVTDNNNVVQNISGSDSYTVTAVPTIDFTFNNNGIAKAKSSVIVFWF